MNKKGVIEMLEDLKSKLTEMIKKSKKQSESSLENKGDSGDKAAANKPEMNKKSKKDLFTNMIILFLGGVLLVIVGSIFKPEIIPTVTNKTNDKVQVANNQGGNGISVDTSYKEKVEKELIAALEHIDGVGKVHVMIYFEGGEEQLPVFNSNESKNTTNEKDTNGGARTITQENGGNTVVMTNEGGNQKPVIGKTLNPKITGILVTAEGASDKITELRVRQAVLKLFGLADNKVEVYPMKK
jgi:stage III sporulation protein AG